MINYKNNIMVYQFIDDSKVLVKDYISKLVEHEIIICFDLEDSIKGFGNRIKSHTDKIKSNIFKNILFLLSHYPIKVLGIRINETDTDDFYADILLLKEISNYPIYLKLFLPKVKTKNDIQHTIDQINLRGIKNFEIIPIIESQKGINSLSEIVKCNLDNISKIAFGHCDYNYDCNVFPFFHQNSIEYWIWVKKISGALNDKMVLLNSPYLILNDDIGFIKMLKKLSGVRDTIGQITLSIKQSLLCKNFIESAMVKTTDNSDIKSEIILNKINYAVRLINEYNKYKVDGKNFSVNSENKKLISPQEYLKAKGTINKVE